MISVLMASYNGEKYISDALESILKQSYSDYTIYIHDDGSTDSTLSIIKQFADKYPEKIKLLDGEINGSATRNFLQMLRLVESDWYMFADQDDIWKPNKIESLLNTINGYETRLNEPILAFSDIEVVDADLKVIGNSFFKYCRIDPTKTALRQIITQNIVPGCACIFNRSLRNESMKYHDLEKIIYHDWWMACVASATGKIIYNESALVLYRQHDTNVMGASKDGVLNDLGLVFNLWRGTLISRSRDRVVRFVDQATQLSDVSFTNFKDKRMIKELEHFNEYNKIQRIKLFMKYGITRSKRNIWMYFMA